MNEFITGAVTQPCRYKGALQPTNSGVCIAEQIGLSPVLKESIESAACRAEGGLKQHYKELPVHIQMQTLQHTSLEHLTDRQ